MEKTKSAEFKNVFELVETASEKYAKRNAISFLLRKQLQTKTFEQVQQDVRSVAGWLAANDFLKKKVALLGATDYEWVVCFLAVLYSGSTAMPMNYTESTEELRADMEWLEPDLLLYGKLDPEQTEWVRNTQEHAASIFPVVGTPLENVSLDFRSVEPESPASVLFTTGSSGKKKGVVLSQKNMVALYKSAVFVLGEGNHQKELVPVPNYHLMKISTIVASYGMGIEHFISRNSKRTLKDIAEQKPSVIQMVPLLLEAMRKYLEEGPETAKERLKKFDENLRTISVGGAFSDLSTLTFFENLGIEVLVSYGMTEAGIISGMREGRKKQGSVGEIMPGTEIRIVDGEIQVRGNNVMLGYYKNPEETEKVLGDGWVHTGDLGYVDEEGYLFLTGRKKNLIILANGENVSPEELEEQLSSCEEIQEVLVKEKNGHLHAEIFPNEASGRSRAEQEEVVETFVQNMNRENVMCKRIVSWNLRDTPFEKVNGMKIKRN